MSARVVSVALFAFASLAGSAQAAAPVARLSASRTDCVAPCSVYLDARASTDADLGDRADNLLDLTYVWDFGDPGSGSWGQGARAGAATPHPRNVDSGFVAGHVYETPGTYTARVTVSDGTSSSNATALITVTDPAARWPGTSTVCIANGAFPVAGQAGCPAGAAVANNGDFDAVLVSNGCHNTSRRCLFRRGDQFTASGRVPLTSGGPNLIGAYGTGAKPRVTLVSGGGSVFGFDAGNYDIRIVDLELRGNDQSDSTALGIGLAGNNPIRRMLLLRLDISHFDNQLAFRGVTEGWVPRSNISNENAIVDSTILDGPGWGGNDLFVVWERSLFLGNRIGDKFDLEGNGHGEHIIRARHTEGVAWNHNSMGLLNDSGGRIGCGTIRVVMKIVSDLAGTVPNGISNENVFADNFVSSCKGNAWDLDIGRRDSTMEAVEQGHRIFLVERNFFSKRFAERNTTSLLVEGEEGVVRNNVFDLSGANQTGGQTGVRVWNRAPVASPPVPTRDVRVHNNTCYRDSSTPGGGTCVDLSEDSTAAIVRNNLLYEQSPGSDPSTFIRDNGVGTLLCAGCNVTAATSPFSVSTPLRIADFGLAASSSAVDSGEPAAVVPVNFDVTGTAPRDGNGDGAARVDLGAIELNGAPDTATPPAAPVLL